MNETEKLPAELEEAISDGARASILLNARERWLQLQLESVDIEIKRRSKVALNVSGADGELLDRLKENLTAKGFVFEKFEPGPGQHCTTDYLLVKFAPAVTPAGEGE